MDGVNAIVGYHMLCDGNILIHDVIQLLIPFIVMAAKSFNSYLNSVVFELPAKLDSKLPSCYHVPANDTADTEHNILSFRKSKESINFM